MLEAQADDRRSSTARHGAHGDMTDRVFTISFAISLGVHLVFLLGQTLSLDWLNAPRTRSALEVIYEYEIAQRELRHLETQLARAKRDAVLALSPDNPSDRAQIRVPDRPELALHQELDALLPGRPAVVDLTNLVDAARGDPILLTYFSAIREQIQQVANRRAWLTGETRGGLVYISFTLASSGSIQDIAVVSKKSAPSQSLWEIAVRIVNSAAPFPPFPPSVTEATKTIVVPLEFLMGS